MKKGPIFSLELDLPGVTNVKFATSTKMLLVWARRFPRGVERLFSVRVFISPPSDGVLLRLYLSTVLGVGRALLPGG